MKTRLMAILTMGITLGMLTSVGSADSVTIGVNQGSGNDFPFGDPDYTGEYQQIYSAADFSGPVEITGITFFGTSADENISGDFTIDLSTTTVGVQDLSTTYADNIGSNNTQFFSGSVSNVLSFSGGPFLYDPSQGNLLIDVEVVTPDGNLESLDAGCSTDTNRVYNLGGNGTPTVGNTFASCTGTEASYGLETEFTFTPVSASTPEPSSILLLGTGLLALVLELKRKRFARHSHIPSA